MTGTNGSQPIDGGPEYIDRLAKAAMALAQRKRTRAWEVARYLRELDCQRVVVATCGNSAAELRAVGLRVLELGPGPGATLRPNGWLSASDIARMWPGYFDATPGHLPLVLFADYATSLCRVYGGAIQEAWRSLEPLGVPGVPILCGSGEGLLAVRWAMPKVPLVAVWDQRHAATVYETENPLVQDVAAQAALCLVIDGGRPQVLRRKLFGDLDRTVRRYYGGGDEA